MKKKLFGLFAAIFLAVSLWAQDPTKAFPYYYYNTTAEARYYSVRNSGSYLDSDEDMTIYFCKSGRTFVMIHKYNKKQSESSVRSQLKDYQDLYANLDSRIDSDWGRDMDVCLLYLNPDGSLICEATYSKVK